MILHRYFGLRYLKTLGTVTFGLGTLLFMIDLLDKLNNFGGKTTTGGVVALTLLNLPSGIYLILPMIFILATITLFLSLARSSELVVTRAAGRSGLRALTAPLIVTLAIGGLAVAALNPIVAATKKEYEIRASVLRGDTTTLAIAGDGLWLRQGDGGQQTVIRAEAANLDGTELSEASFLTFTPADGPIRRISAATAELGAGSWQMRNVKVWDLTAENPERDATHYDTYEISSTLTPDQIRDSFGTPSSVPIWDLPRFIARLEAAGFSARRHRVFFQTELALPFFLAAMVMIGAVFTMRPQRSGRTALMVLWAILISVGLYFVRNFATILGENGQVPVALAAWAPPLGAIGIALGILLHLEDG